jgi:hypothetical protein
MHLHPTTPIPISFLPSARKPQSHTPNRCTASLRPATKNTNPTSSSSATTRSSTVVTQGSSSAHALTPTTTSWRIWRRSISSSRCWIASLGTCVSWIWCSTFIRWVLCFVVHSSVVGLKWGMGEGGGGRFKSRS